MKHYNVKILMTALLSTAFSLTAGAQDFGGESAVNATTLWKFTQYYNWDGTATTPGSQPGSAHAPVSVLTDATKLFNFDGLYIHMNSSGGLVSTNVQNTAQALKDGDETLIDFPFPTTSLLFSKGNGSPGKTYTAGAEENIDAIAFNALCPGTAYVLARGTNLKDSDPHRFLRLYFNGVEKVVHEYGTTGATYVTLKYTSTESGTFYFKGSTSNWVVMGVYFVPTTEIDGAMTKTVTIGTQGWATFSASQNYKIPDGLEAYYVSNYSSATGATLTKLNSKIPANTGVMLHGDPGDYTPQSTATADAVTSKLTANIGEYALPSTTTVRKTSEVNIPSTNFILTADGASVKFAKSSGASGKKISGNKAFLRIATADLPAADAHEFGFVFADNGTTGIADVKSKAEEVNCEFFNLAGQRVAQPTKGLYIVNGKKVIIK